MKHIQLNNDDGFPEFSTLHAGQGSQTINLRYFQAKSILSALALMFSNYGIGICCCEILFNKLLESV